MTLETNRTTLTSENPFNTVQEGVNFSGPGDIVYVAAGTYVENVSIKRTIFRKLK